VIALSKKMLHTPAPLSHSTRIRATMTRVPTTTPDLYARHPPVALRLQHPGIHPHAPPAFPPCLGLCLAPPPTSTPAAAPRPTPGYPAPMCVPDRSLPGHPSDLAAAWLSTRPHCRSAIGPPCVTPDLTTARLSGPHMCARLLPAPMPIAQLRTSTAALTPRRALRALPPPQHRCLVHDQRLLQPGPATA
jgi:hypothetical protein